MIVPIRKPLYPNDYRGLLDLRERDLNWLHGRHGALLRLTLLLLQRGGIHAAIGVILERLP